MPFSEEIDQKVQKIVSQWGAARKKMFGGTCYLLHGNMMCGVYKDNLILRLGESQAEALLAAQEAKPFDITGKPMKGWVMIEESRISGPNLSQWLEKAREFAVMLPQK